VGEETGRGDVEATPRERRYIILSFLPRGIIGALVCFWAFVLLRAAFDLQRLSVAVPLLWLVAAVIGAAKTLWAARHAEWFCAKYVVDTERILALMPSGVRHEAKWCDLSHMSGVVRPPSSWPGLTLAGLANLIWPKTGVTLHFRSGVEVVVPFSPRPASPYAPVAHRIALAGPSDNALQRLLQRWEEWRLRFFGPASVWKLAWLFHLAGQTGPAALLLACVILREADPTFEEQSRPFVLLSLVLSVCFFVAVSALVSHLRRSRRE